MTGSHVEKFIISYPVLRSVGHNAAYAVIQAMRY